jgi:hypothetical protein
MRRHRHTALDTTVRVARVGDVRKTTGILLGNMNGRYSLGDLRVGERKILKRMLQNRL